MQKIVYLSLGSNLGDRAYYLEEAIRLLEDADLSVLRRSSVYDTEPRDLVDQPRFLNIVIEAGTRLFPRQLLARIQRIEGQLGRRRVIDKGPRTIDIDILLYGRAVIDTRDLTVPHPRLHERRFVLEPLVELSPVLRHPATGVRMRDLLNRVTSQTLTRLPSQQQPA